MWVLAFAATCVDEEMRGWRARSSFVALDA
jgi:hypothetical protein